MAKDSRDLIRELLADGWRPAGTTGSHHHFKHPVKPGKVTIPHPKKDLHPKTVRSIYRQAQIARKTVSAMAGYVALIHKDAGTSYGVSFPDVPGCISAGDTLAEAVANAGEALAGHLALLKADDDTIPVARSLKDIGADPAWAEELEGVEVRVIAPARPVAVQAT